MSLLIPHMKQKIERLYKPCVPIWCTVSSLCARPKSLFVIPETLLTSIFADTTHEAEDLKTCKNLTCQFSFLLQDGSTGSAVQWILNSRCVALVFLESSLLTYKLLNCVTQHLHWLAGKFVTSHCSVHNLKISRV